MRSPYSNQSLIEWLERQPAGTGYNWVDQHNCALCQYFRSMGFPVHHVSKEYWAEPEGGEYIKHPFPAGWNNVVMPNEGTRFTYYCVLFVGGIIVFVIWWG